MLQNQTIEKMCKLKLNGMAEGFQDQLTNPVVNDLSFADRLGLLIDREETYRDNVRLQRLLRQAKFKYHAACAEDIDYSPSRGLKKSLMADLLNMTWVHNGLNLLVTGPTGTGKTWLACAIGQHACRQGISTIFKRVPLLLSELQESHSTGEFRKLLQRLAKPDLLILDDLGVGVLTAQGRSDLMEVVEIRSDLKSTIVTSQLPIDTWHGFLGSSNKTVADAIMDRLIGGSVRLNLSGDSLRGDHNTQK